MNCGRCSQRESIVLGGTDEEEWKSKVEGWGDTGGGSDIFLALFLPMFKLSPGLFVLT